MEDNRKALYRFTNPQAVPYFQQFLQGPLFSTSDLSKYEGALLICNTVIIVLVSVFQRGRRHEDRNAHPKLCSCRVQYLCHDRHVSLLLLRPDRILFNPIQRPHIQGWRTYLSRRNVPLHRQPCARPDIFLLSPQKQEGSLPDRPAPAVPL